MFSAGGIAAAIIYASLLIAHHGWLTSEGYQRLVSAHEVVMVFGVRVTCSLTVFGQFFVPLMIGAENLAFPRLGLMSWYLFALGCLVLVFAALTGGIGPDWLILSPQMSLSGALLRSSAMLGIGLILLSLWAGGEYCRLGAPPADRRDGLVRLPLFVWAQYSMGMAIVCGIPVGIVCLLLIAGTAAVSPQRLFLASFYPIVLASLLPPAGTVSEVITCFSRRRIHGYRLHVLLMLAVPVFALLGWGQYQVPEGGLQVFFSLGTC